MNLYIDSIDNLKTIIKLGGQEFVTIYSRPQDQDVLGSIHTALKSKKIDFKSLTAIEVNSGPGSFTGTRVGVAIANALSFALSIPINNQKPPLLPTYSQPPNITPRTKN